MAYAHQGIELKALPGIAARAAAPAARTPVAATEKGATSAAAAADVLTRRGTDVLVRIERLMEDASRALASPSGDGVRAAGRTGGRRIRAEAFAAASGSSAPARRVRLADPDIGNRSADRAQLID